jgi:hypothetical protein
MARGFGCLPNQWAAYARLQANRFLVPGDACLAALNSGCDPVRLTLRQDEKVARVIGAAICRRSRADTRSWYDAAQVKLVPRVSAGRTSR